MTIIVGLSALRPLFWIFQEWRHCGGGICAVSGTPPEWDFAIFWQAGRLALNHDLVDIFEFQHFRACILSHLHYDVGLSPFAYPPTALLIFAPLARLPLACAYLVWVIGGAAALLAALRAAGLTWLSCLFVLLSPPFLYNLLLGQNGALTASLLIAALLVSGSRPIWAGWFAALLLIKPQMALLLPAAWLGARRWRALASACGFVLALLALSALAFGVAAWRLHIAAAAPEMVSIMDTPAPQSSQVNSITSFVLLRALGASVAQALLAEYALAAAAFLTVLWAARHGDWLHGATLTILLTLLIMPYGHVYDMIPYAAVLALIAQRHGPSVPLALFWAWPAISRDVVVNLGAPLTPIVILLAIAWVRWGVMLRKQGQGALPPGPPPRAKPLEPGPGR
jgi:hypothetical protein